MRSQQARRGLAVAIAAFAILFVAIGATTAYGSSTASLKTVTASDKTASIGLPSGWTLVKSGNGYIGVNGPNGDSISLGASVVVKNAQSGTGVSGEVAFAMPFSATLQDKFTQIMQSGAQKSGMSLQGLTVARVVKTKLPMCALLLGGYSTNGKAWKYESVICSLQPDILGLYKNLVFFAKVPASSVAQERPVVEQIIQSYRVTPAMFRRLLAPYTPLPPMPAGGAMPAGMAPYQDPTNSDCFDYNIIRESPPWEMPMHCGGWQPG